MRLYQGTTVYFRLVELSDAEFILNLRLDPKVSRFLSPTDSSLDKQVAWLQGYKEREAKGQEFYYIVHRRDNDLPIGTIRIYDFDIRKSSFCWGSWIVNSDKTVSAALESSIFISDKGFFGLGFNHCHIDVVKVKMRAKLLPSAPLGFNHCHIDVVKTNAKVLRIYNKMGYKIVDEDERLVYHSYPKQVYEQNRSIVLELIQRLCEIG